MSKLYIAYGSNLHLVQMGARCPSASIYAKGVLNNWELIYRGSKTGSHATIRRKKGATVPVLVWDIQTQDEKNLDMYEGFPVYYYKQNIMVEIAGGKRKAMVYIMNDLALPGIPLPHYVNTIRQGYKDNGFDMSVLEESLVVNSIECR